MDFGFDTDDSSVAGSAIKQGKGATKKDKKKDKKKKTKGYVV